VVKAFDLGVGFSALRTFHFLAWETQFCVLDEVQPFCILGQNVPAKKARNRPCSISRAERKADWPKFFVTFRQYTYPWF
jgi:hypothetical protein